jgi:hypothetical protein
MTKLVGHASLPLPQAVLLTSRVPQRPRARTLSDAARIEDSLDANSSPTLLLPSPNLPPVPGTPPVPHQPSPWPRSTPPATAPTSLAATRTSSTPRRPRVPRQPRPHTDNGLSSPWPPRLSALSRATEARRACSRSRAQEVCTFRIPHSTIPAAIGTFEVLEALELALGWHEIHFQVGLELGGLARAPRIRRSADETQRESCLTWSTSSQTAASSLRLSRSRTRTRHCPRTC